MVEIIQSHPIPVLIMFIAAVITILTFVGRVLGYRITKLKFVRCARCDGTGRYKAGDFPVVDVTCEVCQGRGYLNRE